jgi:hypothetical protein
MIQLRETTTGFDEMAAMLEGVGLDYILGFGERTKD